MVEIVFVMVVMGVIGVSAARVAPTGSVPEVVGFAVLFFVAAGIVWSTLMFLNVLPIDAIGRRFGVYDMAPWYQTFVAIPPLVGAAAFAVALWRRGRP
jgi:hypothetical protein